MYVARRNYEFRFCRMKKYILIGLVLLGIVGIVIYQNMVIGKLKIDRDTYRGNTETLLDSVKTYKTKDSLNAASVGDLVLRLSEFQRYRAADAALIKTLETKNRDLQNVTTTQTRTINNLRGNVRDSIVYLPGKDNLVLVKDTLRCLDIVEPWFELHGCSNKAGEFTGVHLSRDSLLIAATVKYKRFLGFLWKTNKVKDRKIDVVSKNPGTEILGVEYIEIRK